MKNLIEKFNSLNEIEKIEMLLNLKEYVPDRYSFLVDYSLKNEIFTTGEQIEENIEIYKDYKSKIFHGELKLPNTIEINSMDTIKEILKKGSTIQEFDLEKFEEDIDIIYEHIEKTIENINKVKKNKIDEESINEEIKDLYETFLFEPQKSNNLLPGELNIKPSFNSIDINFKIVFNNIKGLELNKTINIDVTKSIDFEKFNKNTLTKVIADLLTEIKEVIIEEIQQKPLDKNYQRDRE